MNLIIFSFTILFGVVLHDRANSQFIPPLTADSLGSWSEYLHISQPKCNFRKDFVASVKDILRAEIVAQDEALEAIVGALSVHQSVLQGPHVKEEARNPLAIAFTGGTGLGKSETARLLAKGLYSAQLDYVHDAPCGFLMINGKNYAKESSTNTIPRMRAKIKNQIIEKLIETEGQAFIVIDEVQSILPGVIGVLETALDDVFGSLNRDEIHYISNSMLSGQTTRVEPCLYEECPADYLNLKKDNEIVKMTSKSYSTKKAIFLFISDIGSREMLELLLEGGTAALATKDTSTEVDVDREIDHRQYMSPAALRSRVKDSLDEQWNRIQLGQRIKEVVPFLPLTPSHMKQILINKVQLYTKQSQFERWLDIAIDEDALDELITPKYLDYNIIRKQVIDEETGQSVELTFMYSITGARKIVNGGPFYAIQSKLLLASNKDRILHIGYLEEEDPEFMIIQKKWKDQFPSLVTDNLFYFQWCKPIPTMAYCTKGAHGCPSLEWERYREKNAKQLYTGYSFHFLKTQVKEQGYSYRITRRDALDSNLCQTFWVGNL